MNKPTKKKTRIFWTGFKTARYTNPSSAGHGYAFTEVPLFPSDVIVSHLAAGHDHVILFDGLLSTLNFYGKVR